MATRRKRKKNAKAKQKTTRTKSKTTLIDLTTDMLFLILSRLSLYDCLRLSVVSKFFRSLTDVYVHKLIIRRPLSNTQFLQIFSRFTSITHMFISLHLDYRDCILNLPSEAFGTVKVLKLSWSLNLKPLQFAEFLRLFPSLEELDLHDMKVWKDDGIDILTSSAPNLRRFNLSKGMCLTDRSLDALLANCVHLEQISFKGWERLTARGICAFLRKRKNLKFFEMPTFLPYDDDDNDILTLAETLSSCENLTHLFTGKSLKKDVFLNIIANSRSPLVSLDISAHLTSMSGISALVRSFQKLTKLRVFLPYTESDYPDTEMSKLVKFLPLLKAFSSCSNRAPYATLFSLINNCRLLESIIMISSPLDTHRVMPQLIRKNYSIERLYLFPELDSSLKSAVKSVCPSLNIWG